jgi:two-component system cell cycle response regulator DivK
MAAVLWRLHHRYGAGALNLAGWDGSDAGLDLVGDSGVPSVLLIDSDEPSRKLARLVLEEAKWRVVVVGSTGAARALLAETTPDLIVTEIEAVDGYAQVTELRLSALDVPIIAVTSLRGPRSELRAFTAGCSGFIPKPIDITTFPAQLLAFVGDGHDQDPPRRRQ